jgi:hypothetical protein
MSSTGLDNLLTIEDPDTGVVHAIVHGKEVRNHLLRAMRVFRKKFFLFACELKGGDYFVDPNAGTDIRRVTCLECLIDAYKYSRLS